MNGCECEMNFFRKANCCLRTVSSHHTLLPPEGQNYISHDPPLPHGACREFFLVRWEHRHWCRVWRCPSQCKKVICADGHGNWSLREISWIHKVRNLEVVPAFSKASKHPTRLYNFQPSSWLLTAYVARREGYVLTCVCPSVCPHLGRVPRPGPDRGGGVPSQVWPGGGVNPAGGYPISGTPCRTWLGVPHLGYPPPVKPDGTHLRYPPPPSDLARGTPAGGGGTRDGVLDTPPSVSLWHSCRRTFLFSVWIRYQ